MKFEILAGKNCYDFIRHYCNNLYSSNESKQNVAKYDMFMVGYYLKYLFIKKSIACRLM